MATLFTDDFNSYNDGDLNGQGDWVGNASFDVQAVTVFEGAKAVSQQLAGVSVYKDASGIADGKVTVYMQLASSPGVGTQFGLLDTSNNWRITLGVGVGGAFTTLSYFDGASWITIGSAGDFTADTWHSIEIEFESAGHTARYTLDGGTPTDWDSTHSEWTNIERFLVYRYSGTATANLYFDYIAEEPYPSGPTDYTVTVIGNATITEQVTIVGKYHITVDKSNDNH